MNLQEPPGTSRNPQEPPGTPGNLQEPPGTSRIIQEPQGTPRNPKEPQKFEIRSITFWKAINEPCVTLGLPVWYESIVGFHPLSHRESF